MADADTAVAAVYAGIVSLLEAAEKQSGVVRGQMVRDAAMAYWAVRGDTGAASVQVHA